MKKFLILLPLILLAACSVDTRHYAPESDFKITVNEDNASVTITIYAGSEIHLMIPPTINGLPVTVIGEEAFAGTDESNHYDGPVTLHQLHSVVVPRGVMRIEERAFRDNLLVNVSLPDGLTHIKEGAFARNKLTGVVIPDSVIYLSGFQNNNITDIKIPDSVKTIGGNAFENNRLVNLVIPDSVTEMGWDAFKNNRLESIKISENIPSIRGAFAQNKLTSVVIPDSVLHITGFAFSWNNLTNVTLSKNLKILNGFSGNQLTHIDIPDSVERLGSLSGNRLTRIVIPKNVEVLMDNSFDNNEISVITVRMSEEEARARFECHEIYCKPWKNKFTIEGAELKFEP